MLISFSVEELNKYTLSVDNLFVFLVFTANVFAPIGPRQLYFRACHVLSDMRWANEAARMLRGGKGAEPTDRTLVSAGRVHWNGH